MLNVLSLVRATRCTLRNQETSNDLSSRVTRCLISTRTVMFANSVSECPRLSSLCLIELNGSGLQSSAIPSKRTNSNSKNDEKMSTTPSMQPRIELLCTKELTSMKERMDGIGSSTLRSRFSFRLYPLHLIPQFDEARQFRCFTLTIFLRSDNCCSP